MTIHTVDYIFQRQTAVFRRSNNKPNCCAHYLYYFNQIYKTNSCLPAIILKINYVVLTLYSSVAENLKEKNSTFSPQGVRTCFVFDLGINGHFCSIHG